jgi:hypothetical protein
MSMFGSNTKVALDPYVLTIRHPTSSNCATACLFISVKVFNCTNSI